MLSILGYPVQEKLENVAARDTLSLDMRWAENNSFIEFLGEPKNCSVYFDINDVLRREVLVNSTHFIYGTRNESLYLPGDMYVGGYDSVLTIASHSSNSTLHMPAVQPHINITNNTVRISYDPFAILMRGPYVTVSETSGSFSIAVGGRALKLEYLSKEPDVVSPGTYTLSLSGGLEVSLSIEDGLLTMETTTNGLGTTTEDNMVVTSTTAAPATTDHTFEMRTVTTDIDLVTTTNDPTVETTDSDPVTFTTDLKYETITGFHHMTPTTDIDLVTSTNDTPGTTTDIDPVTTITDVDLMASTNVYTIETTDSDPVATTTDYSFEATTDSDPVATTADYTFEATTDITHNNRQ
ncbi:uncharacterized protein [Watersipora subatra]|uniref:uncharacterized protein n=1 Tax=Watersipora subatra TaxID=2589382 RepID=UPI00355B00D4